MKKHIFFTALAAFFLTASRAQQSMVKSGSGTTFGIRAGVNFQNINGKDAAGNELNNVIRPGFHAGLNAELPLGTGFYLQPGVLYSSKGSEWSSGTKVKISYVEVPLNFVYKPVLGTGNMLLGFGPYVAAGIGGKIKPPSGGIESDIDFDQDYNVGYPSTQFKRFDAGANLLAGYEFASKLSFQVNAQLGLMNIHKDNPANSNDKTKWKNTGFGVSLGYRF